MVYYRITKARADAQARGQSHVAAGAANIQADWETSGESAGAPKDAVRRAKEMDGGEIGGADGAAVKDHAKSDKTTRSGPNPCKAISCNPRTLAIADH